MGGKFLQKNFSNPRGYFLKNQSDFTQKSRAGKILGMENGLKEYKAPQETGDEKLQRNEKK